MSLLQIEEEAAAKNSTDDDSQRSITGARPYNRDLNNKNDIAGGPINVFTSPGGIHQFNNTMARPHNGDDDNVDKGGGMRRPPQS